MKNSYIKLSDIRIGSDCEGVYGAVWIGLRQATPGKFIDGLYEFNKDQIFVRVTNTGITVASGAELEALSGSTENAAVEDYKFDDTTVSYLRTGGKKFKLEITLIGDNCKVYFSDPWNANNCPKHTYNETISADAPATGFLSFGIGDNHGYGLYSSLVRNLDDSGNAIDFDSANNPVAVSSLPVYRTVAVGATMADVNLPKKVTVLDANGNRYLSPVVWSTTDVDTSKPGVVILNGTVVSTDALKTEGTVTATAKITVLDTQSEIKTSFYPYDAKNENSFLTTWNSANLYTELNFKDLFCSEWGSYTGRIYSENYPWRTDKQGEYYSRIAGISPIDENGNVLELRNFELTFDYRVPYAHRQIAARFG